jgi:HAD superfamily hydrolase (TIGR01509 family)
MQELFDVVVTGDDVVRHKPDPEAYRIAAERLAVPVEACLVFEDSDAGVASAVAAGMAVVRVRFTEST